MMKSRKLLIISLLVLVPDWAKAEPQPLNLVQIGQMQAYLECEEHCYHGPSYALEDCLAACPTKQAHWEKNQDSQLDMIDARLAVLEYWDESSLEYICYQDNAVQYKALCEDCLANHTQEQCTDADSDGIPQWKEEELGIDDSTPAVFCHQNAECDFRTECEYYYLLGQSICTARDCGAACTAFHLENVAENNQELIVHLHYDYSPTPARVLSLLLEYPDTDLTLLDVRPLPLLKQSNKQVIKNHLSNGMLKLVVIGTMSKEPIPTGAIVELVFARISANQTTVRFTKNDFEQEQSLAPSQGDRQQDLRDDALWGDDIQLAAADPNGNRLLLSYSFENPRQPLEYQDTKDAHELCTLDSSCNILNQDQDTLKTKKIAMLSALQRGVVSVNEQIAGVLGHGVYLDGYANHLEMPITLNDPTFGSPYRLEDQGFSVSFWFYADGNAGSLTNKPQVLFSHNNSVEKTRFGLLLQQKDAQKADLLWFEGGLSDAEITKRVVGKDVLLRTWTHVGMAVDAEANRIEFYLNGESTEATTALAHTPAIQCPQFETSPGTGIILHDEGDLSLGARSPEVLFYAAAKNNLYGIERMDLLGLSSTEILRDGNADVKDPDYSPLVDKLVYSSNKSGNYEIWIANGDGSNPRQITLGFGDTSRKIFSRRPKWAPDASAIVFESNTYSIPDFDNWWARGYHLYYIQYDPQENEVAIPINGNKATQLDYQMLLQNQIVRDYRLTIADQNHYQAVWLKGKSTQDQTRGELLMNTADLKMENKRIYRLTIPHNIIDTQPGAMVPFAADPAAEVSMVTAKRVVDNKGEQARMLLKKEWNSYESTSQYSLRVETLSENEIQVAITHTPDGYDPYCFDTNHNNPNVGDSDEDRNQDGTWDERDCYPAEVRNLYISYDAQSIAPNLPASGPGSALAKEEEGGTNKELELKEFEGLGNFVRIEVLSPYNNTPLPASAEIAKVVFSVINGASVPSLVKRIVHQDLFIKDLTSNQDPEPFLVLENHLEHVLAGAFSPDGTRLLLSGIQRSRPILVVTKDIQSTDGMEKISNMPMRVEGLNWIKQERYYPCNWFGAHRDRYTKRYLSAFRGGLDELKLYSYVREADAFRSDAQRGLERLAKENRDGQQESKLPQCATSDFECPPYHLCINEKCQMIGCDPDDPYTCIRGQCTLAPVATGAQEENLDWVCAVECNYDRECFEEECLNGPCRFCDAQAQSCMECRLEEKDFGSFKLESIEGCPDRNSFACEEGSCVTQCYSFENGESTYLCNPALEYCKQGRCVLFDWDWTDFAPATFSGLGEMAFSLSALRTTTAISQLYPIEIQAYGVKDYLHSPEVLVQGKVTTQGAQVYNGAWFDVGRISVYNITKIEATSNPYIVHTPYPVTDLRLRLITPPYENLNASSTGLMAKDKDFCVARMEAIATKTGTTPDYDFCTRRASGSRSNLGYRIGLPAYEVAKDCYEAGYANCNHVEDENRKYLYGGQPAAIILDVKVNGTSVLNSIRTNKICSYQGSAEPVDPNGEELRKSNNKKVFFGDSVREQSNQKAAFHDIYANAQPNSLLEFTTHTGGAWALLNCNFADRDDPNQIARVELSFNLSYPAYGQVGNITETANNCVVAVDDSRIQPCYEQIGSDGALDVMNQELQSLHTLDYSTFRSFGYDFVPCQYVTCSGHGTCTYENQEEHCTCDEGYAESEGLRCVEIES